jgi:hypothetical protein
MLRALCHFLASCGISYASPIYGGVCKVRLGRQPQVEYTPMRGKEDYRTLEIKDRVRGAKSVHQMSRADPMDKYDETVLTVVGEVEGSEKGWKK